MQNYQVDLTINGKRLLEEELDNRKNVERPKILEAIKEARDQGDLSENADYDAARNKQSQNEERIKEIEEILKHAHIIDETEIKVLYVKQNVEKTFKICGSESNPFEGKISSASPLAKAVAGHKAGDKIFMTTETGADIELVLLSIN